MPEHIQFHQIGGASRFVLMIACVGCTYLVFIAKKSEIYSVFLKFESRFSDRFVTGSADHEVFLPEYFQSTILHAAHFRRVVNSVKSKKKQIKKENCPLTLTLISDLNIVIGFGPSWRFL